MREEIQKFHNLTLATYNALMHENLVYPHHIITESSKVYHFEDDTGGDIHPMKGYLAMKEVDGTKKKYFITEEAYSQLPIRVKQAEEMYYKDSSRSKSIILNPTIIKTFRINPEKMWEDNHNFIDEIAPFKHTQPTHWKLNKIIAVIGYIGKTFIGVCSHSEFGKSSIYLLLDGITQQCPVFQPRSVPGVLVQITSEGNMIFDEVHDAPSDVKACMENFSLQVAANSPIYINGAMKSKNTKPKYDVGQQSITYLYNVYNNYSEPSKQFWNHIWSNRKAMESRFLTLKLNGRLEEEFDKDFNIPQVAEKNKMFYINIAKHLLYLKKLKLTDAHKTRFQSPNKKILKGRHKIIYDEILWGLDVFSRNQEEYTILVECLNKAITDYDNMITMDNQTLNITQERIE